MKSIFAAATRARQLARRERRSDSFVKECGALKLVLDVQFFFCPSTVSFLMRTPTRIARVFAVCFRVLAFCGTFSKNGEAKRRFLQLVRRARVGGFAQRMKSNTKTHFKVNDRLKPKEKLNGKCVARTIPSPDEWETTKKKRRENTPKANTGKVLREADIAMAHNVWRRDAKL